MAEQIDLNERKQSRRQWLRAASGAAVLLPVVHLTGCGSEEAAKAPAAAKAAAADAADAVADAASKTASAAAEAADAAATAAGEAADQAADAVADAVPAAPAAGGLTKIEESDPVAKALSYVHDAAKVDTSAQPRFAAGQNCGNCAQFQKQDGDAGWGGCAIFPGKLVATGGWCAGYVAAS
jgi:hypothetical protein